MTSVTEEMIEAAAMRACPHCGGTGKLPERFGDRLKERRESLAVTQEQLSQRMGGIISRPQIANLEAGRGDPSVPVLIALSAALDVTTDWLLKGGAQ